MTRIRRTDSDSAEAVFGMGLDRLHEAIHAPAPDHRLVPGSCVREVACARTFARMRRHPDDIAQPLTAAPARLAPTREHVFKASAGTAA